MVDTINSVNGYLATYFYTVPRKNHDAISQNLKKFIPWFENKGVKLEYYHLADKETQEMIDSAKQSGMDMENFAKTISPEEEADIWMELQHFKDQNHSKEVYAKMMSDKSLEPLGKEFMSLITHGGNLITGVFNRLEQ
jgi:hypothetical protein